jgi:hypothetical protein
VPCGQAGSSCLLVGDNEEETDLYLYRILNQGSLEPAAENGFSVRLGELEEEVSDIEAIAITRASEILVFGSHGRDRSCNAEGKRRRFLRARYEDGKLEALGEGLVKSKKISCRQLFEKSPQGDAMIQAVCAAIDTAEEKAEDVVTRRKETKGKDRAQAECEQASPFNLEGAVAVNQGEESRVWIGLRSPQAEFGSGPPKAVLLRMAALDRFEFNAAALVDLNGRGIRELSESGEWIWGIAGPAEDSDAEFSLWRFPKSKLEAGAVIKPEIVRQLPASSEGLAFDGDRMWVMIDGGRGKQECTQDPRVMSITIR